MFDDAEGSWMKEAFSARGGREYIDGWAVQTEGRLVVLTTPVSDSEGLKDIFAPEEARKLGEALIAAAEACEALPLWRQVG